METRAHELEQAPLKGLVLRYSFPTVLAMVINSIYNVIDRIFVGRFVGEEALAGLTIAFPIMLMTLALGNLLGGGAIPLISIKMGAKQKNIASQIFGTLVSVTLVSGILISICGLCFTRPLLQLFGSTAEAMPFAYPYMQIIFFGLIFHLTAINLSNTVRIEGYPGLAMITLIFSALCNIVLDFLFVVIFKWGINGAAWATIIGQALGACWLISFYLRGKSALELTLPDFLPRLPHLKKMLALGFSSFVTPMGGSFAMLLLNRFLKGSGGTPALTAMGAINSLYSLFIMPLIGIQLGLQPIISFNYGAGQHERERKALYFGFVLGVGLATIVWLLMEVLPRPILSLFIDPSSPTITMAITGLRLFVLALPLVGFQIIGNSYYMAINRPKEALFLSALRQFILLIPFLYMLSPLLGITGIWISVPIADGVASLITMLLILHSLKKEK
jgi:putative MATE family efflux protein